MILYVEPGAFGLVSSSNECIAAISYCSLVAPDSFVIDYSASPSSLITGVLPSLHDDGSDAWIGGFEDIIDHLKQAGLDAHSNLDANTKAQITAFSNLFDRKARTLTAISLFADEENYTKYTRKALSENLPFPRNYTVPYTLQRLALEQVETLPLDSIPSDRPRNLFQGKSSAALQYQARQIRIQSMADDLYSALESKLSKGAFLFGSKATSIDCLVFGHLALHLYPAVPNDFLAQRLKESFPRTWKFVVDFHASFFEERQLIIATSPPFTLSGLCKSLWNEAIYGGPPRPSAQDEKTEEDKVKSGREWRSKALFIGSAIGVLVVFVLSNNMIVIDTGDHEQDYLSAEDHNDTLDLDEEGDTDEEDDELD